MFMAVPSVCLSKSVCLSFHPLVYVSISFICKSIFSPRLTIVVSLLVGP